MLEHEEKLVREAKKGDREAFTRLYEHYVDSIYRFVLLKVNNREEAEDLTNETFLSSWQNLPVYEERGLPFSSWLYRIARNKVIDHYRVRKAPISIDVVEEDAVVVASNLERAVDIALDVDRVKACLVRLTPEQKDVTIMRFVEELSHKEIAEIIGKSEGAVRLIQHRAIATLRAMLSEGEPQTLSEA